MPNVQRLRTAIDQKGIRIGHVAAELGITRQALNLKMRGITEFRVSEIQKLSDLLMLSAVDREAIFFDQKGE